MSLFRSDILIIGSGLASLSLALKMADLGKVTILSKEKVSDANSRLAQGGIAAVSGNGDSFENHINDTMEAGAGLCNKTVVQNYITQAPERIMDLINWGVVFDKDLTQEGGHHARRIYHFEDQTGLAIHSALLKQAQKHSNIEILENHFAIDLILNKQINPNDMSPAHCVGCYSLNRNTNDVDIFVAKQTILATGGSGKVYLYTSNWSGATGDGVAMAYRRGARVANLEMTQFHPTCLYHEDSRNFLISEALRGEGGKLIDHHGYPFMEKYHPMGALAPRDIVARSIDAEMKKSGAPCVYLDMTHKERAYLKQRFPLIYEKCAELGIDIAAKPIPVVPAAHYQCGGVLTDINGQTDIENLWAIGEVACTGFHGANRLASNSLLECLTMSHNCSLQLKENWKKYEFYPMDPAPWVFSGGSNADELIVITHMWDEVRRLMWNYVGIVRTNKRLQRAHHRLINILSEVKEYYSNMKVHSDILELRNISIVADLSVRCALKRHESRGIHFNLDYPNQIAPKDTII